MRVTKGTLTNVAVLCAVVVFASVAQAQIPPAFMYPFSLASKKALPVGTPIWTNFELADVECSHPQNSRNPSASDDCMRIYRKGRILKIVALDYRGTPHYVYEIEYEFDCARFAPHDKECELGHKDRWSAFLDDAYKIGNLPEEWASYSQYFIRNGPSKHDVFRK